MRHGAAHPKHARQLAFRRGLIADEQLAVKDELFKLRSHARDQADLALDRSKWGVSKPSSVKASEMRASFTVISSVRDLTRSSG
jgi:hypothetical protein